VGDEQQLNTTFGAVRVFVNEMGDFTRDDGYQLLLAGVFALNAVFSLAAPRAARRQS